MFNFNISQKEKREHCKKHSRLYRFKIIRSLESNWVNLPDILCIASNRSIRAELACIANILPLLCSEIHAVLVILIATQLCSYIAFQIAQQVIMVWSVPACTIQQGIIQFSEVAAAAVRKCAVNQTFYNTANFRIFRENLAAVVLRENGLYVCMIVPSSSTFAPKI